MDEFTAWFNRNKCTIYKVGIAVLLSVVLIAVFAGAAATGGAGTGLAGLLATKIGLSVAVAGFVAKTLLVMVSVGVSASIAGDWVVCTLFDVPECCHPEVQFWKMYGGFVQDNGGGDKLTPPQCAELKKLLASLRKLPASTLDPMKKFLQDHCDDG